MHSYNSYFARIFQGMFLSSSSSVIISSTAAISNGLPRCAVQPSARERSWSALETWAVTAIMGVWENSGRRQLRCIIIINDGSYSCLFAQLYQDHKQIGRDLFDHRHQILPFIRRLQDVASVSCLLYTSDAARIERCRPR